MALIDRTLRDRYETLYNMGSLIPPEDLEYSQSLSGMLEESRLRLFNSLRAMIEIVKVDLCLSYTHFLH